jgi:tripartite-type tricarboxylate transporter receptor subunit TctC
MKAEKDGYNILANGMLSLSTLPVLGYADTTPKDWDFYLATFTPNVLAVRKDSPYQTAQDLLDAMKAKPGEITDATGGMVPADTLALKCSAQRPPSVQACPVEGGGKAVTAALSGEVDLYQPAAR